MHNRTVAAIAVSSLLAAFAAQAQKGAAYSAPAQEPEFARFMITGGATYLLPTMNGLDYATYTNFDTLNGASTAQSIDRNYNWGYYLAAGYMISDRYDVQVSWAQSDATNSTSSIPCDDCFTTNSNGADFFPFSDSSTHETMNYQAFDGSLGQYHTLGEDLMARVFAGVRYAKISNNTTNDYFEGGVFAFSEFYDSSFSGWGPEVGVDLNYEVYDWFSIVGHFAAAFLVGELDSNGEVLTSEPPEGFAGPSSDAKATVVPALDAKLGLSLGVPFWNEDDRFTIEAGYQIDYYFNVVNQLQVGYELDIQNNYADVGLMGPYANLSVKF